ncbi:kielin/chordin-like protein, partial [Saccostrea cucullata]|uniref:kielin/chordin-like protein n=1 Tax=Saccostrea cuccullata TaxID=36930 RepID=UPI002ED37CDC
MACVGTETTTAAPQPVRKREMMTTTTVPQTGGCHYNGKTYWAGDSFRATDGCNTCYCSAHGGALCTEMFCGPMLLCHYNGTDH